MRMFDHIVDEPGTQDAEREAVPFCAEMGVSVRSARQAIRALAARGGYATHTLAEWSSADAPGPAPADLPVLHYAALLPYAATDDDMPLGMGATAAEALGDLLWELGAPLLLDALAHDDPEPEWDDMLAEELARSELW